MERPSSPLRSVVLIALVVIVLQVVATVVLLLPDRDEASSGTTAEGDPGAPMATRTFTRTTIGSGWTADAPAQIAHVNTIDLDGDGRHEVVVADARTNSVQAIYLTPTGEDREVTLADNIAAPARVEATDLDNDGDIDLLVASMGRIFPNNDLIGAVILLENDGTATFTPRTLIDGIARVTDVRAADFDGDGRRDLVVGQFGYHQGEIRWMRNLGDGTWESEILLDRPGTIHVPIADFDRDGDADFAALVTQDDESIYLFRNNGRGSFTPEIIWGSPNADYASSGMVVADLDQDGWPDLVFTNGDGFDYASPGPRAWHGVQWLRNLGGEDFEFRRIGRLPGAYGPQVADFNNDGRPDILVCSWFNDWRDPAAVSLRMYYNEGSYGFIAQDLATDPTHLVSSAGLDFDGDGDRDFVTCAFYAFPPMTRLSRITLWTNEEN